MARLSALFERALEVPTERRAEFVAHAAGDDSPLRRELQSLLAAHESSATYFDGLAAAVVSPAYAAVLDAATTAAPWAGRRLGAWRLVREIGRGGMSCVFLAERADGAFERRAALKLLRPGLDADVDVERFHAERRILASLDHPNIARLLDGGMTEDARPYLVLELVDGVPIDRYCEERDLTTEQRLSLFLAVADAVEHAHHRAVVHRDLKPSNILVTSDGVPKLLDFGVAKLVEEGAAGTPGVTRTAHRWMTPQYAAPEQVRGEPSTPSTDVYQLGVVLYELLSGRTPFACRTGSLHALEAAVLEREPDALGSSVPRDLDAIASKALRKRPAERYGSVRELADDVRRHLAGFPVTARRRMLGYRAGRFAARHRSRLAAMAVASSVLMASIAAVGVERARARRALAVAPRADTVPALLRALGALDSGAALADTARARRLLRDAVAASRADAWPPAHRVRALAAAARVHLALGEHDGAFGRLQESLVLRRTAAPREPTRAPAPGPTDAAGGRLLFVRLPGIVHSVAADGTGEVRAARTDDMNNAAWAPDGRRMLVSRQREPRGIHVVDPDGSNATQVTAPPLGWSDHMPVALGGGIAFTRIDERGGRSFLYRVALDGSGLERLTVGQQDGDAAPFPGGQRLAFSRKHDIYVLDVRTRVETRLTRTPARYKAGVAVSPDGRRIAFTRIDPGRLEQIFVMHAGGTETRRVSRGDHYDFLPRWSPDGTRIAFTSVRDGTNGVYTMRADGSDVRDVSRTPLWLTMRPGRTVLQVNETLWAWAAP